MTTTAPSFVNASKDERWKMIDQVFVKKMSCGDIARALSALSGESISRNVIVGMFNRRPELKKKYGIVKQVAAPKAPVVKRQKKAAIEVPPMTEAPVIFRREPLPLKTFARLPKEPMPEPVPEPEALNIRLMELSHGRCKWPTSEDHIGHMFCGVKTIDGHAYCPKHRKRATIPNRRKFNGRKT